MRFVAEMHVGGQPLPVFAGDPGEENNACFDYEAWIVVISPELESTSMLHALYHEWRHARFALDGHTMWDEQEQACDDFARCALETMAKEERQRWMQAWDVARDDQSIDPACSISLARIEAHLRK